jgi:hypothetical protein
VQGLRADLYRLVLAIGSIACLTTCTSHNAVGPNGQKIISITPASDTIEEGSTIFVRAGFEPNAEYGWAVDNTGVVLLFVPDPTDGAHAAVIGDAPGTVVVTVYARDIDTHDSIGKGSTTVTVLRAIVREVQISPASPSIAARGTIQFRATPYGDGLDPLSTSAHGRATWTLADPSLGTIDANGLFTADPNAPVGAQAIVQADIEGIVATSTIRIIAGSVFPLTVAASELILAPGQSGTATATVDRGQYTPAVTFTVIGLPDGLSGTVGPNPLPVGSGSAVVTVKVDPGFASGGVFHAVVEGLGTDGAVQTAPLTVIVSPAQGFTLAVDPGLVVIPDGSTGSASVRVIRGGFFGSVSLSGSAPGGITASFTPPSVTNTGTTSICTIHVPTSLAPGTYLLTITGTSPGAASRQTDLYINVTPSGFTLHLSHDTLHMVLGSLGTDSLAVTPIVNGFTGPVTMTADPGGLCFFTPNPVPTPGTLTGYTVVTCSPLSLGTYPVTLTGTAPSGLPATTLLTVIVEAPSSELSLAVSPVTATVQQGTTAITTPIRVGIHVVHTGYVGPVTVDQSSANNRVTVLPRSISLAPGVSDSAFTVDVSAIDAVVDTIPVTVFASGRNGLDSANARFVVTVQPYGGTFDVAITLVTDVGGLDPVFQMTAVTQVTVAIQPDSTFLISGAPSPPWATLLINFINTNGNYTGDVIGTFQNQPVNYSTSGRIASDVIDFNLSVRYPWPSGQTVTYHGHGTRH